MGLRDFVAHIEGEHTLTPKSYKVLDAGTPFGIGEGLFTEVGDGV